ncbi:MAG: hypothetical protein AB8G22_27220 [Saprospiraceae bacterium]
MKNIPNIISRLETISLKYSNVIIEYEMDKLTIEKKKSKILLLIFHLLLIFVPWMFIYLEKTEVHILALLIFAANSILTTLSYYQGVIKGDNHIEINFQNQELILINVNPLGKMIFADKTLTLQRNDKIIKRSIPLYDSDEVRLILQQNGQLIPLIDLENDSVLAHLSALLNIMIKRIEVIDNQNDKTQ